MVLDPRMFSMFAQMPGIDPTSGAHAAMRGIEGFGQGLAQRESNRRARVAESLQQAELGERIRATQANEALQQSEQDRLRERTVQEALGEMTAAATTGNYELASFWAREAERRAGEQQVGQPVAPVEQAPMPGGVASLKPIPALEMGPAPAPVPTEQPAVGIGQLPGVADLMPPEFGPSDVGVGILPSLGPTPPGALQATESGPVQGGGQPQDPVAAKATEAAGVAVDAVLADRTQAFQLPFGMGGLDVGAMQQRAAQDVADYFQALGPGQVSPEVVSQVVGAADEAIRVTGGNRPAAVALLGKRLADEWAAVQQQKELDAKLEMKRIGSRAAVSAAGKPIPLEGGGPAYDFDRLDMNAGFTQMKQIGDETRIPAYRELLEGSEAALAGLAKAEKILAVDPQNPNVGALLQTIISDMAKANNGGGRLTDKDVTLAEGIKSLSQQAGDFLTKWQRGALSADTVRSMRTALTHISGNADRRMRQGYQEHRRAAERLPTDSLRLGAGNYIDTMYGSRSWHKQEAAAADAEYGGPVYSGPVGSAQRKNPGAGKRNANTRAASLLGE
jgi:hypothetical protein